MLPLKPSLRLAWVPAIAMALVVAAMYLVVRWWVASDIDAASRVRVEQRSLLLAGQLESSMGSVHLQLRQLSRRLALRPASAVPGIRSDLEWLQTRSTAFAWIGLASPEGVVVAGTQGWLEGESVRERPVFAKALREPFIGDFHPAGMLQALMAGSRSGAPSVADMGIPIFDAQGRLRAVLVAHIDRQWLLALGERIVSQAEQEQLGLDWFLLDSRGQPLNEAMPFRLAAPPSHWSGTLPALAGDDTYYVSARPLTLGPDPSMLRWTAVASLRGTEAAAPLYAFDRRLVAASLGAVALAALLGYVVSGRLMRPYDRLVKVASQRYQSATATAAFTDYLDALSSELEEAGATRGTDTESALLVQVVRDASQLRHLLDSLPVGVCILGEQREVLYANACLRRYLGHLEAFEFRATARRLADQAAALRAQGDAHAWATAEVAGEGGAPQVLAAALEPLRRDAPHGQQVLMLRDITREHEAGRAAQEAIERMEALGDAVQDQAFITLDAFGTVRGWSRGGEQILGWTRETTMGLPFSQLFAPGVSTDGRSRADDLLEEARRAGPVPFEAPMMRADGRELMVRGTAYALRQRGAPTDTGTAVILTDATGAIESARRLRESEQRLTAIVDGATDAIISADGGGRITLFNPAAEQIFRRRAIDVVGAPMDQLLPPEARAAHGSAIAGFGRSGVTRRAMGTGIVQGLRSDGVRLDLQASISKTNVHGHMVFTAILRDVSGQLASQRREQELQQERAALTQRLFNQDKETTRRLALSLHDELGQTAGALRLFFDAHVAHLAADGVQSAGLQRLDDLLDKLHAQIRSVLADLRPPLLDELGLVAALENEVQSHAQDPLRVYLQGDAARRWPADVEWCAFLIAREALNNARRHSGADSVDVLVEGSENFLRVSVVDNGTGVDDLATRVYQGHLGIVGMRERAAAIGAHLDIESSSVSGTEISIEWRRPP